jgi:hypothetical protein
MLTRLRLLRGATALLYVGPLFAGISGLGWGMVAPFVAIFVVWLMVLRPEQWPATADEWLTWPGMGAALSQVLSQILLVSILLAVGRGVGAVAGFLPMVDPIFPLAVSFLAIPLCRILWDADEAADLGIFLDEEAEAAHAPRAAADAAKAIVPLLNLPDAAPDAQVQPMVAKVMDVARPDLRLSALAAALAQPDRSHDALRRALILWASEPERVAPGLVPQGMATAFGIAQRNADLLRLYVPRALALVAAFPARAGDFPTPQRLAEVAAAEPGTGLHSDLPAHLRADLRDGLFALARAVERAQSPATAPAAPHRPAPLAEDAAEVA